jgi:hypothetical protein
MKNFFSKHSYDFVRMLLVQSMIGGFFGFALAIAVTGIGTQNSETGSAGATSETLLLVTSVCAIIFYLFLLYVQIWEIGGKDQMSHQVRGTKPNIYKGLLIALCANVPNFLLAGLITVGFAFPENEVCGTIGFFANLITKFIHGMYLGIIQHEFAGGFALMNQWWVYFLLPIPALLTSFAAYNIGRQGWHLTGILAPVVPASDRPTKEERREARRKAKEQKKQK